MTYLISSSENGLHRKSLSSEEILGASSHNPELREIVLLDAGPKRDL